jgi:fluoroquinolone transport system permease protein
MATILTLLATDARQLNREPFLRFMLLYPLVLAVFARWVLPFAVDGLAHLIDLSPYLPIVGALFSILVTPILNGLAAGFLLLDEKDAGTLLAIRVTPFSASRYLLYRMLAPVIISLAAAPVLTAAMDLFHPAWLDLLLLSLAGALLAPLIALLLALVANNKVQGFALAKGMGLLVMLPVASWFVGEPWQWLFGLVPTFWPVKAFWLMLAGEPWLWAWAIGMLYLGGVVYWLYRLFRARLG